LPFSKTPLVGLVQVLENKYSKMGREFRWLEPAGDQKVKIKSSILMRKLRLLPKR
jgi:hypothetical protein